MELITCTRCRRLFNYISGDKVCPVCKDAAEEEYHRVKNYVYDHPGATIQETSVACEVSEKLIRQWLKEERLELVHASGELVCESCGRPLISGRYCEKCKQRMVSYLKSATHEKKEMKVVLRSDTDHHENKMRFL